MTARVIDAAVARVAARRQGIFTRTDVVAHGGDDSLIRRRVAAGRWLRAGRGVYLVPGVAPGFRQRLWIAVLTAGPTAVVSHRSAGALAGLTGMPPGRLDLTVPHGLHLRIDGCQVHQTRRPWPDSQLVDTDGLRVTSVAATLVDLSGHLTLSHLERAFDEAEGQRLTSRLLVAGALAHVNVPGRHGLGDIARILDGRAPGDGVHGSILERRFAAGQASAGAAPMVAQFPFPGRDLPGCCADFADPVAMLIVEIDGRTWHARLLAAKFDRERDLVAARAGYLVLRILGETYLADPTRTVAHVEEVRALRRQQLGRTA